MLVHPTSCHPLEKHLGDVTGQALGCARSTRVGGVLTKNGKNKREIQKKTQDQEEEELDSLEIATQIIPIANTPRSNNNKKERYKGSYYKSIREVDLEKERQI